MATERTYRTIKEHLQIMQTFSDGKFSPIKINNQFAPLLANREEVDKYIVNHWQYLSRYKLAIIPVITLEELTAEEMEQTTAESDDSEEGIEKARQVTTSHNDTIGFQPEDMGQAALV